MLNIEQVCCEWHRRGFHPWKPGVSMSQSNRPHEGLTG